MADGGFRFHQSGTGQYYGLPQQHPQQHNNHRNLNRATSPHSGRRPFNTDTPSPSRSPVSAVSTHTQFTMYNHSAFQGQHAMMNGGQNHQRYNMPLPKHHSNHHTHYNQTNHHHSQHHHNAQGGHQHNISSGGFAGQVPALSNFDQVQNGNLENLQHDDMDDEYTSSHWREQMQMAQDSRQASSPHHRARVVAQNSKGMNFLTTGEEGAAENRSRALTKENGTRHASWDELDLGGQGLHTLSHGLFNYDFMRRLNLGHNQLDRLPPEIGQLKSLEHLDVSSNRLTYLPEEIGMLTKLKTLLLFDNRISTLPFALGYLFKLTQLGIEGNPLDEELKARFKEDGPENVVAYLLENMPDPDSPNERDWIVEDETPDNDPVPDTFTAFTYNILCDRYATERQYQYVPRRVLSWDYRKELILNEIVGRNADIVCLQELDKENYDEYFQPKLAEKGYKSYFGQKKRAETLGSQAKYVDGCGTFWKEQKFIKLDAQYTVLGRKAVGKQENPTADMINRVWQKDTIATHVFLENRATGSRLIVANSHIFWDPLFKDVQLIEAATMMDELTRAAEEYVTRPACTNKTVFRFSDDPSEPPPEAGPSREYASGADIPMIICGDFNSGVGSAVYDLFTKGSLPPNHPDFDDRDYGSYSLMGMKHPFTLRSSYHGVGELPFTNYTPMFMDVLDYIWYSSNCMRVKGVLGEVDRAYLQRVPGFPNFHYPSDHLSLMAEYSIINKKGGQAGGGS